MMRSMRLSLRFLIPLILALSALAYLVVPLVDNLTLRWFVRDLDIRSELLGRTFSEPLSEMIQQNARAKINGLFAQAIQDERLFALAFCDAFGQMRYKTSTLPASLHCKLPVDSDGEMRSLVHTPDGPLHLAKRVMEFSGQRLGELILVHDMSFVDRRSADTRKYVIALFGLLAGVISLITVFVAHLSWRGWIAGVRAMLRGDGIVRPFTQYGSDVQPLVGDFHALLRALGDEQRLRDGSTLDWTPDTLRQLLHENLSGDEILVVSNREPYMHADTPRGVEVQRPASGLITAVEPVMRACSGTWIAHGSGSADRRTVNRMDHVAVPPNDPTYTLRRIWLTKEEEKGYYEGFANEGLWPLCLIAHVRPIFRSSDWEQYLKVNQRFADAVVEEARTDNPVVLVQDYHFALLPKLIKERLPKATIITFWHIPWPNPESFGICPWRDQILEGLLGSTILGFQTRYHCNNFLETVDRFLETRIEREHSTVSYGGQITRVEHYPISIHWPADESHQWLPVEQCRDKIRSTLGMTNDHFLLLGVDRLDYTKGIVERFQAIELLLERRPELIGKITLVQIAAPTRSALDAYQAFEAKVRTAALRINERFASGAYQPICLKLEHHDAQSLIEYYRASDACLITSLHDGMNLVAKEFVAARDDERGVLILSQFTGAARELHEALIVNPYHIEQIAEAIHCALRMPAVEQRERMRSMRALVRDFNIYRWAGRMLLDASRQRQHERIASRINSDTRFSLRKVA
ncbi:alpha,alpha-trehalose-phosphate synthase (UDP-forming) [Polaromonas sp.]|uniref:alpha,alpha-trehalose-phosphate synthase (UDP-forming) n=1 Tax=Polaromonas sp. TaxID=1869339 RepID=UPI002FCC9309